jgi:hypothetical protein
MLLTAFRCGSLWLRFLNKHCLNRGDFHRAPARLDNSESPLFGTRLDKDERFLSRLDAGGGVCVHPGIVRNEFLDNKGLLHFHAFSFSISASVRDIKANSLNASLCLTNCHSTHAMIGIAATISTANFFA